MEVIVFLEEGIGFVYAHVRRPDGRTAASGWILGRSTASDIPVYMWEIAFQYALPLAADCLKLNKKE